uniref:Uncharacterized protein n=1 Tax=Branchiostoma floridae TaxID=7739 RepID=C3YY94_BRAFL|eukprot:XP_002598701.1 hypothetical protein BRAFLDRAFT_95818 [Branchiostoma floridae]
MQKELTSTCRELEGVPDVVIKKEIPTEENYKITVPITAAASGDSGEHCLARRVQGNKRLRPRTRSQLHGGGGSGGEDPETRTRLALQLQTPICQLRPKGQ